MSADSEIIGPGAEPATGEQAQPDVAGADLLERLEQLEGDIEAVVEDASGIEAMQEAPGVESAPVDNADRDAVQIATASTAQRAVAVYINPGVDRRGHAAEGFDFGLTRDAVPEGVPCFALVIEGVVEVPWPAGVTWLEAVRYGLGKG